MLLKRFRYYYSVTGDKDGLFSLSFEFCPTVPGGEKPTREQLKGLIRKDFSKIEALLNEALLGDDKKNEFEKLSTLKDSVVDSTFGFQYAGKNFSAGRATVAYRLGNMDRQATVSLKLQLTHHMNMVIFDEVMKLPDLHIEANAQENIQQMEAALAAREQKQKDPTQFLKDAKI